jgi:hypothetical protein
VDLLLGVDVAQTKRDDGQHVRTLDRVVDQLLDRLVELGRRDCLDEMVLAGEQEMQRHDTQLRRDGGAIGRSSDDEVDVARAQLLEHGRLLAELGAGNWLIFIVPPLRSARVFSNRSPAKP